MSSNTKTLNHHYVGEKVYVKGTGKRWTGSEYSATIVDVKEGTIKLQYDDGGFKRFTNEEFNDVLMSIDQFDNSKFGVLDCEWSDDQFNPIIEMEDEFTSLREEMHKAAKAMNFTEASKIKQKVEAVRMNINQVKYQKALLKSAILREDYQEAEKISKLIESLKTNKSASSNSKDKLEQPKANLSFFQIVNKALKSAFRGGISGAIAMVTQVSSLMWMRTIMNYQYQYGMSTKEAAKVLYAEGGLLRFYRGYSAALIQGPLSRFGDTAANVGVLELFNSYESTKKLPAFAKTFGASIGAALFRIFLMPVDTIKTTLQVEGQTALKKLREKSKVHGFKVFYHGALGASFATFAGHYPWFATFNTMQEVIPVPSSKMYKLLRNAGIGFCSSVISDTISNSLRVLKTYRQTHVDNVSYMDAARQIIEKDGVIGLFGRGLKTRIITNGAQGLMFSVIWKWLDEKLKK